MEEQRELEAFKAAEERRLAMQQQAKWEADDEAAMLRWRDQQSRLAQAKAEKVKREVLYCRTDISLALKYRPVQTQ